MVEIKKRETLQERLNNHYLNEFIQNNPFATAEDYSVGQLYADAKTQEMMKLLNQWEEDGSPK